MKPERQSLVLATAHFDAYVKNKGMTIYEQPVGTEGYRGIDLSSMFIYRRPDGTLYGTNYPTKHECREGNIEVFRQCYPYLEGRNATYEAAKELGPVVTKAARIHLFNICSEMTVFHSAADETKALLMALNLWEP